MNLYELVSIFGDRMGYMYYRRRFDKGWDGIIGIEGMLQDRMLVLYGLFLFIISFSSFLGRYYLLLALHWRRLTFVVQRCCQPILLYFLNLIPYRKNINRNLIIHKIIQVNLTYTFTDQYMQSYQQFKSMQISPLQIGSPKTNYSKTNISQQIINNKSCQKRQVQTKIGLSQKLSTNLKDTQQINVKTSKPAITSSLSSLLKSEQLSKTTKSPHTKHILSKSPTNKLFSPTKIHTNIVTTPNNKVQKRDVNQSVNIDMVKLKQSHNISAEQLCNRIKGNISLLNQKLRLSNFSTNINNY